MNRCIKFSLLALCVFSALAEVASACVAPKASVTLAPVGETLEQPHRVFVLTHGMGGVERDGRFLDLAMSLKKSVPDANVYLLDWSDLSQAKGLMGLPNPWAVASRIDRVGRHGASLTLKNGIKPHQIILIGESFGVYVNHRIATELGGVSLAIALNPANENAGYPPPDLRSSATRSLCFVTASPYDTQLVEADQILRHDSGPDENPIALHTIGIRWLRENIQNRHLSNNVSLTRRASIDDPDVFFFALTQEPGGLATAL